MEEGGRVVMFPFMAQGHLNPLLDLAKLLATQTQLTITIVNTPLNIKKIQPVFHAFSSIHLAEIPFRSSDHGLPPDIENTDVLPPSTISHLYHVSSTLQPSFHRIISELHRSKPPILCIIADMFLGWTVDVAEAFSLFHATLYTSGPYAMSIYNSIWINRPHAATDSEHFTLPDVPNITLHRSQLSKNAKAATGTDSSSVFVKQQADYASRSCGSLWNTVQVLEKQSLDDWARKSNKPVWAIGPLLPLSAASYERGGKEPGVGPDRCREWLDLHPVRSVVYISFGSQNSISASQMMELAVGLELSGKPFVWVVRPPLGVPVKTEFSPEWLPEGFEERMKGKKQGLLVRKWAPQLAILSHGSTGIFLSHCGWNSVLESLSQGVPIVGWPLASEQFYNSKLLEDLGVGFDFARGTETEIRSGDVAEALKSALESEKGKEMKQRAEDLRVEMKRAVSEQQGLKGTSLAALDDFVRILMSRGTVSISHGSSYILP